MRKLSFVFIFVLCLSFVFADIYTGEVGISIWTEGYSCVKDDVSASWIGSDSSIIIVNETGYNFPGTCNQTSDWCCPNGYTCEGGMCISTVSLDTCYDFKSQDSCEGGWAVREYAIEGIESFGDDFIGICSRSLPFVNDKGLNCVNASACDCVWDDGVCVSELNFFDLCVDGNSTYNESCYWSEGLQEDKCESEGIYIVNYIVSGDGVNNNVLCVNQTKNYPCSVSVKVPFFDFSNFIISALGICCIYFVFRRSFSGK